MVGGLIVGNPDDTRESIEANLAFARRYVDWPYIQHPTPYPRTPMTREFRERDLIVDEDVAHYDGTTAVVRTEHVGATRSSSCAGVPSGGSSCDTFRRAFLHSPGFVLRHGGGMLAHTFARQQPAIDTRPGERARRLRSLPQRRRAERYWRRPLLRHHPRLRLTLSRSPTDSGLWPVEATSRIMRE